MKILKKEISFKFSIVTVLISFFVFSQMLVNSVDAWDEATANPPADNVEAPINTSNIPQRKEGALTVGSVLGFNYSNMPVFNCESDFAGLMRYNTDNASPNYQKIEFCNGTSWGAMGGGKFTDGTNPLDAVYTAGNVGIGINNPPSSTKLYVNQYEAMSAPGSSYGTLVMNNKLISSTGLYNMIGQSIATTSNVASGVKNNGYLMGLYSSAFHRTAGDLYTLYGIRTNFGNFSSSATGTVDNAYGILVKGYKDAGTITNGYGLFIDDIKATNDYGIYQTGVDDVNYFAGNMGIGTNNPTGKLDVAASAITSVKTYDYGLEIDTNTSGGWARSLRLRNLDASVAADSVAFGAYDGSAYISAGFDNSTDYTGYQHIKMFIKNNGNVGIGTNNPTAPLDINSSTPGPGGWRVGLKFSNGGTNMIWNPAGGLFLGLHSNGKFYFGDESGGTYQKYVMTIDSETGKVWVNGDVYADAFYYNSDKRLKKNIRELNNYEDILKVSPKIFDWKKKEDKKNNKNDIGVIAQDVEKYFPQFVNENNEGFKSVNYPKLVVPLIGVVKQQQDEIEKMREDIEFLKNKINKLK